MAFILGNNLTGVAVGNLLKLLSMLLPTGSRLPKSKYLFEKYFNSFLQGLEHKYYCPSCETLFKTSEEFRCSICNEQYEKEKLLEQGSFFIPSN